MRRKTLYLLIAAGLFFTIFVMEQTHRAKLQQRFKRHLKRARVICLDIPDNYAFMDPALVALLEARVPKFL